MNSWSLKPLPVLSHLCNLPEALAHQLCSITDELLQAGYMFTQQTRLHFTTSPSPSSATWIKIYVYAHTFSGHVFKNVLKMFIDHNCCTGRDVHKFQDLFCVLFKNEHYEIYPIGHPGLWSKQILLFLESISSAREPACQGLCNCDY